MPPRNSRNGSRKTAAEPQYTAKLLAKESIPIIDKSIYDKVYPSSSKSLSQLQYGMTETELNNLPKPNYTLVPGYYLQDMPHKPDQYICFKQSTQAEIDSVVEYDMDDEDAAWLEIVNQKRKDNITSCVEPEIFEFLMDRFEKECRFHRQISLGHRLIKEIPDDDAVCYICTGGTSCMSNEIVFCDMCNIASHQECYGVPYVPECQWICRRCNSSPTKLISCDLCPNTSGVMKQTDSASWCHILCALWTPEVQFSNSIFLDPICCTEKIPAARWKLNCHICKKKDIGACLRCKKKGCRIAFHVSCAQQAGYAMMMKAGSTGYKKQRVDGIYCPKHAPKCSTHLENTNNIASLKHHVKQNLCANVISIPHIPLERIKEISELVDFEKKNIFIRRLLAYWTLKRYLRNGVPMIQSKYLYMQQGAVKTDTDTNPPEEEVTIEAGSSSIQQEQNIDNDQEEKHKKLKQVKKYLETTRELCELIKNREKLKNELTEIRYKCLELKCAPLICYLRKFTDLLVELDIDNLFSKAVDGSEAVNARPTDLVQIRSKVDTYQYSSLEEYENDFEAMIASRIICNGKRTKIYKSASRLKEISRDKFLTAYKEIAEIYRQNQELDEESEDDMPEPLSPQIKPDHYENPSVSEFATEIDYYGYDPGPSTSSYQPPTHKTLYKENDNDMLPNNNAVKEGSVNTDAHELVRKKTNTAMKNNKKVKKIKIRKMKKGGTCFQVVDSPEDNSNSESLSDSSQPQPKVNRRTAVLFTKNKTRPKYRHRGCNGIKSEDYDSYDETD